MASRTHKPKKQASYPSRDSQSPLQDNNDVETEQSEESQAISMGTVMTKMVTTQRKRHAAKKKGIYEDYDATYTALEASINSVFAEHEAQAAAAHEAQLKRLQEMLVYKAKLEKELAGVFADLKATYDAHSQDVEMVISFKAKGL